MGQNSYPPQAGTASKHPPLFPNRKCEIWSTPMRANVTNDHNIQVHMQQCHQVKNSHTEKSRENSTKGIQVDVWMEDYRPLRTFYLSSVWGRSPEDACWSSLWVPTDWWLWAHVVVPLVAKESTCNQEDPWASMQKQKETKWGGHPWCTQYPMCLSATWWMPSKPAFSGFASTMFQMASLTWPNPLEMLNFRRCTGLGSTFKGTSLGSSLCRTRCGLSPICCRGAPGAHPRPSEGPHCPRWYEESGSSPSFPSKNPCTICSNSLHVSHPSLFGPFFRGWHCSKPSHIPCAPRRHGACLQDSSSSCSLSRRRRPRCSQWWVVCVQPRSPCHRHPQWWWMEQGNGRSAVLPGSDDRYKLVNPEGVWHLGLSDSRGHRRGFRFMASMAAA